MLLYIQQEEEQEPPRLVTVDLSNLGNAEIAPPEYVIEPVIPRGYTTLLGGHGGSGKTIVAESLAAHVACGKNWGPFKVKRGRAVFLSLEDPAELLLYRLRRICEQYTLPLKDVSENLELIDGTETTALAIETNTHGKRSLLFTKAADELSEKAAGADLVGHAVNCVTHAWHDQPRR